MASRHLFYPGRRVKAICTKCKEIVTATYGYGTVPLQDGTPVEGVMRAICDRCGSLVATAPQSTPLVRAAIETRNEKRPHERKERTTVRIPRVLADFARWELFELKAPDPERFDLLVKAFIMSLARATEKRRGHAIEKLRNLKDPVLEQPCDYLVALNFSEQLWKYLKQLQLEARLPSTSELVRRILVLMERDQRAEDELRNLVLIGH